MKRISAILIVIVLLRGAGAQAQGWTISEYDFHAGIGFPASPQSFYDYYKSGFNIGAGFATRITDPLSFLGRLDYSAFSVDKARYYKGVDVDPDSSSIAGGSSTIITASGLARYFPTKDIDLPIELLGGFALSYSYLGESKATFGDLSYSQSARQYLIFSAIIGAGMSYPVAPNANLYVEGKDMLPLIRSSHANAGFTSITLGVSLIR